MTRAQGIRGEAEVAEMAIVDTFTKLIFGEDGQYSDAELQIIQAFRDVDHNVVFDSHRDMGAYLRALGVGEMIKLVGRVQVELAGAEPGFSGPAVIAREQGGAMNRRAH